MRLTDAPPQHKHRHQSEDNLDPPPPHCFHTDKGAARRAAGVQRERVLFHYNGHGVPQPTANGEIWVFNKNYTQYIPVSIHDLASWLGQPAIYVMDCAHAGLLVDALKASAPAPAPLRNDGRGGAAAAAFPRAAPLGGDPAREIIILAACGGNQMLPQDSDLSADIFTACLTTPIKTAMFWCSPYLISLHAIARRVLGGCWRVGQRGIAHAQFQKGRWVPLVTC